MLRKGTRVVRLTKKAGQVAPIGTVVDVRDGHSLEIAWDDGHHSITSRDGITRLTEANEPHKGG